MANVTETLLAELNAVKGLKSGDAGYRFWGDVRGDGTYSPAVYVYLTTGGVAYCYELNAVSARKRCMAIRTAILTACRKLEAPAK